MLGEGGAEALVGCASLICGRWVPRALDASPACAGLGTSVAAGAVAHHRHQSASSRKACTSAANWRGAGRGSRAPSRGRSSSRAFGQQPRQQVRVAGRIIGSLSPLATNTGSSIAATRWSSEWLGMPQAHTASYCAWRVCHVVGSSRLVVLPRRCARRPAGPPRDSCPWGRRRRRGIPADSVSGPPTAPITSGAQPCIPAAPCGADDASTTRRSRSGRISAISCATKLPIEKPSRSTRWRLHRLEERDRVVRHRLDGVRRAAGRGADADVVEGDDASLRGERVDQRGVPVVEVAAEVLQQDERHIASPRSR